MDEKQREKLAYLIGVALGDGNLSNPNGRAIRLRVSCFSGYPKIADEILQTIRVLLPQNKVSIVERQGRCFDISVYSNKLEAWMPWKAGNGSKIEQQAHVPEWILANLKFSKACLRGLIQTDGCIYIDRGYQMVNFTNNIEVLALDARKIMEDLGFNPNFSKIRNGRNLKYTVRISRDAKRFIRTLRLYKA
ncbi:MAG: LAGLIDADG family homing endonuclease [Minisyncoccota bacterium]